MPEGLSSIDPESSPEMEGHEMTAFEEAELQRKDRLRQGLPPMGDLNVNINHAEYLLGSGDPDGQRLLDQALEQKRRYYEGKPLQGYKPETQTQTQRKQV